MSEMSVTAYQVMWNRLLAVVEEQGQALIRAAFSPIVRECGDISAGSLTPKLECWPRLSRARRDTSIPWPRR